jgi:L-ascorbate metabolism protein UlaG (beta-lactamase superfamily)
MIEPFKQDDAFLADVRSSAARPGFRIWWLGQSGFLIQHQGRHLLLDPYLSDSLTEKYADTDKPHVRMTARVIDPARLDFINVVTSSHNHTDHLDGQTLIPLMNASPHIQVVVPEANRAFAAERLKIDPARLIGCNDGVHLNLSGFELIGVPAAHELISIDPAGNHRFLGYIVRFGTWSIYHSGDTLLYDGMAERLKEYHVDLALLPINGRSAQRRVDGNLCGRESAKLANDIGAKMVIPCHYDMFEFNTTSPDEFITECRRLGQRYRVPACGQRIDSSEIPA